MHHIQMMMMGTLMEQSTIEVLHMMMELRMKMELHIEMEQLELRMIADDRLIGKQRQLEQLSNQLMDKRVLVRQLELHIELEQRVLRMIAVGELHMIAVEELRMIVVEELHMIAVEELRMTAAVVDVEVLARNFAAVERMTVLAAVEVGTIVRVAVGAVARMIEHHQRNSRNRIEQ